MSDPYKKIIEFLKHNAVIFEEVEHDPVFTSEQAAAVRGFDLHQGAKSLVLKAGDKFVMAIIPGDTRLDSKKLREIVGEKHMRFATPEEVEQVMGCKIGACYPFGNLANLPMFVDQSLGENEIIAFNPGVHHKSIKMSWEDYKRIVKPEIVSIISE